MCCRESSALSGFPKGKTYATKRRERHNASGIGAYGRGVNAKIRAGATLMGEKQAAGAEYGLQATTEKNSGAGGEGQWCIYFKVPIHRSGAVVSRGPAWAWVLEFEFGWPICSRYEEQSSASF